MHLAVAFKTEGGLARCVAALDQRLQNYLVQPPKPGQQLLQ